MTSLGRFGRGDAPGGATLERGLSVAERASSEPGPGSGACDESDVSEQKVQFHDPVIVYRHDREGIGPLETEVAEDDRD